MLFSLVGFAFATHVTTFDVNVRWTPPPFSGLESLVVDPAKAVDQIEPLKGPLPPETERVANLAVKGERALVFTNPMSTWADLTVNGLPIGIIGPYATMRLDGVKNGLYAVALRTPTLFVRTFSVRVGPAVRVAPPINVVVKRDRFDLSDSIYFELDSSVILAESYGLLDAVAKAMTEHPEVLVLRVEGHTDSRGEAAYNQTLSEARASAVREYLLKGGVSTDRIVSAGFGESLPVEAAETEAAWDKNRRVEFMVEKHLEDAPAAPVLPVKKKKGGK
jgi:outer membrane protein OmpA-like peptidoglycan-associated protein